MLFLDTRIIFLMIKFKFQSPILEKGLFVNTYTVQLRGTGHETHAKNALEKNACARANLAHALQKRA